MLFTFEGNTYNYPSTLAEMSLRQRIDFQQTYGAELEAKRIEIAEMPDGDLKENELEYWGVLLAVKTFSFLTGIPFEKASKEISLYDIMDIYYDHMATLFAEPTGKPKNEFTWNGVLWELCNPIMTHDNKITFNEFLLGKEVMRQMLALGKGKWDAMPYLCAIYLRPKGEQFEEAKVNERLEMMLDLPMDIALQVGFFLTSLMTVYSKAFQSFRTAATAPAA